MRLKTEHRDFFLNVLQVSTFPGHLIDLVHEVKEELLHAELEPPREADGGDGS